MLHTFGRHWPLYLIEATLLGIFMLSASIAVALVQHPDSPLSRRIRSPFARRATIGAAMGLTAVALIYSPWGQRSGAHMNPAVTLSFAAMGRIATHDAAFYVAAQFGGGILGMLAAGLLLGPRIAHPSVNHVRTVPGSRGTAAALLAEAVISFALLSAVLALGRSGAAPYTGFAAGGMVALFITFEAPLSGMSMNPARTVASAFAARSADSIWVYVVAPTTAMLLAAAAHTAAYGRADAAPTLTPHAAHRCGLHCRGVNRNGNRHVVVGIEHGEAATHPMPRRGEATPSTIP
ncbi:MAG: aquaporin [Phycisphaeraceae bacterium]|nr:aquaporin [Phycisphaeraceae bacterium]